MYEAVHAHPDGESTVARFALSASRYGYEGIVVRNHGDTPASYDPAAIREAYDIDVVPAVEIRTDDPSRASGFVGSHREDQTIVVVHGGDPDINRFAVEQTAVDVLAHPMAGDGDVNHVLAETAARNGVRLECSLGPVLGRQGGTRVQALADLRKLREIIEAVDAPYVVSADPSSHLQIRAPRALKALGETIGFAPERIERGLLEWGTLAQRNRARQSEAFVEPGVWRVEAADEDERETQVDDTGTDG